MSRLFKISVGASAVLLSAAVVRARGCRRRDLGLDVLRRCSLRPDYADAAAFR